MWIHQKQYILNILQKYGLSEAKTVSTPADLHVRLQKNDGVSKLVNPTQYQAIVGSLLSSSHHARTKHIDIRYYVREAIQESCIELKYCPSHDMITDILTKPLSGEQFKRLRQAMGLDVLVILSKYAK